MEVGVFGAMMMGALPALLLMFYMLGPFEGLFEEQSSFFAFVIGMVAGVVVGVLHILTDWFSVTNLVTAVLIFVVGFAFLDQFLRVVLFNSSRFSQRRETTFYSTSFGLGYGAMLASLWFYRSFVDADFDINAWVVASYLAASFAFAVVHGSTGMLVGFGASEGIVWRFGLLGVAIEAVLNFLWYLALRSSILTASGVAPVWELTVIAMTLAAAYGLWLLRWTMQKVVPDILPMEEKRHRRRLLRMRSRKARRG